MKNSHERRRYPHFIGIGAQKAGTTWAYEQLKAHPEIFVPENKELNFFYSDHPNSWYAEQFQAAPDDCVIGEVSPNYFVRPEIPLRMHNMIPDAKLFCILRNPTDRAFSQWKMARQLGNIPMEVSFIDAFRSNLRWISEQGEYINLIERFEIYYPVGKNMLVLFFDDIKSRPRMIVEKIYKFLNVDSKFIPPSVENIIGSARDTQVISENDRVEVEDYFFEANNLLAKRFNRDLNHWTVSRE